MRKNFKKNFQKRLRFKAEFVRFGLKNNFKGGPTVTLLFKNVTSDNGEIVEDHIWFNITKGFQSIEKSLVEGEKIQFDARISTYQKGYVNYREGIDHRTIDYKLSYPTNIKVLKTLISKEG